MQGLTDNLSKSEGEFQSIDEVAAYQVVLGQKYGLNSSGRLLLSIFARSGQIFDIHDMLWELVFAQAAGLSTRRSAYLSAAEVIPSTHARSSIPAQSSLSFCVRS